MFHRHLLCQVVKQLLPLLHKNNILIKSNILLTYQPLRDFRWFQSDLCHKRNTAAAAPGCPPHSYKYPLTSNGP